MNKTVDDIPPADLGIAPEKVGHVIVKAREYGAKVGAWNENPDEGDADEDPAAILEDFASDPTRDEAASFIDALNDDEQTALVAIAWVGRGTFEPEEFGEAVETAAAEHGSSVSAYLLGMPLLPDYLEEGLERLGYSAEDVVGSVL